MRHTYSYYTGPENGVSLSKKQCRYNGKSYQQGEVWNIPMEKEIGDNNCAECTCHVRLSVHPGRIRNRTQIRLVPPVYTRIRTVS